jgi:hypothetical protein
MLRFLKTVTLLAALPWTTADKPAYQPEDADLYDNGTYGLTPEETFRSVDVPAYRLLKRRWNEERCASNDKIFLGLRGTRLWHTGPVIYDNDGHLVWYTEDAKAPYNFRTQWYKGEQYLTYWSGDDEGGYGSGYYYMYNKHYELYRRIAAHGNHSADLHEFHITPQDTALLTVYDRVPVNLTRFGVTKEAESYVVDSMFQEIDLETGELLFEWRASEHFIFDDCYSPNPKRPSSISPVSDDGTPLAALKKPRSWDWYHINSISKDATGNYLISSRYSHSLSYISHIDGSIMWQLGGKNNSFTEISAPPYSNYSNSLAWQHHAEWVPNEPDTLTVFDNQAVNWNKNLPARVLKIRLNTEADTMTAEVIAAAEHPQAYIVPSQGSVQQLPSGNLFVGYGYASAMTEFSPDGKDVLCDWQYGALHAKPKGASTAGVIQSYRAYKQPWVGEPKYPPSVIIKEIDLRLDEKEQFLDVWEDEEPNEADLESIKETRLWVSWNGATEVRSWMLERRLTGPWPSDLSNNSLHDPGWEIIQLVARQGFETNITIPVFTTAVRDSPDHNTTWRDLSDHTEYRLRALCANDKVLGLWHISHDSHIEALAFQNWEKPIPGLKDYLPLFITEWRSYGFRYTIAGFFALDVLVCVFVCYAWRRIWVARHERKSHGGTLSRLFDGMRDVTRREDEATSALMRGE